MKKRSWAILVVLSSLAGLVFWWLFEYEPVHEGWCKLRVKTSGQLPEDTVITLASQVISSLPSEPNDIVGLPDRFKAPVFYRIQVGSKTLTLALDTSDEPVLCLDTDGDGDFSKEQVYLVTATNKTAHHLDRFGPIRVPLNQGGNPTEILLYASTIDLPNEKGAVWFYPANYRHGRLRLGKQIYDVALADGDFDGQFNSVVSVPVNNIANLPHSDVLGIDYDRDGKWKRYSEVIPLGRMIQLGSQYYGVQVSANGTRLDLKKIEPEQGTLAIEAGGGRPELRLWSDATEQHLLYSGQDWDLPTGKYQTISVVLRLKDFKNNEWLFFPKNEMGKLKSFEISKNQTTRIGIGPPFEVTADLEQSDSGEILIDANFRGCAGEEYALTFKRNDRRVDKPKIKITNEVGKLLEYDTLEYG